MGYGQNYPFCAGKLKLKHIKQSCAPKKQFCSGKLNLNQ